MDFGTPGTIAAADVHDKERFHSEVPLKVLALCGSLREASLNAAMLTMADSCAPSGLHVHVYRSLGDLPLFNPDLQSQEPPPVTRLRRDIASADALLIASPEYAHGVSGVMKNALDWLVATSVFVSKPVVLWNASPRATHALASLRETLAVMAARLIDEAGIELQFASSQAHVALANPDAAAMESALIVLHGVLLEDRRAAGATRTHYLEQARRAPPQA